MFKKVLTYCYKRLLYKKHLSLLKEIKKRDILDYKSNRNYQIRRLSEVLRTAFDSIPYYKSMNDINLENLSYQDFCKIPLLTKDIIRNEGESLLNRHYVNANKAFKNTSGGSTGEPVVFYRTQEQANHGMANYYYALNLNGVNIYDVSVDLWGAERDMYNTKSKFNFRSFFNNKFALNTFVLSDEIIEDYVKRLNKIRPKFIKAYVHSIYDIAKFINRHGISISFKPIIHCTTGPLYPEMRLEIARAFNNARVYNFYGSREVSAIASETLKDNGMSVLFDNVFVEVLDQDGIPVKKGEEGDIVITTLNNFYMPLIRYKIGDRAIKGDEIDFGTLKLDTVKGRTLGVILKKDGTKIDGQFFTTLFFHKSSIKSFQLIQKSIDLLELSIVKSSTYEERELNEIVERIKKEVPDADIKITFCEKISLTSTGKIMYVYSLLES